MKTNKLRYQSPIILICTLLFQSSIAFSPNTIHSTFIQLHHNNHHQRYEEHVLVPHSLFHRNPLNTLSQSPLTYKSKYSTHLNSNNNSNQENTNKASVALSSSLTPQNLSSPTAIIDYILSILTSDIGSIIIGSIGLLIALYNRLSTIDFDSTAVISDTYAESINIQSRNDLLAVFASGAVLLNGISKLDVTSVLAESVVLNGYKVGDTDNGDNDDGLLYVNQEDQTVKNICDTLTNEQRQDLNWAMKAVLSATPAKTAVLLTSRTEKLDDSQSTWVPILMSGIIPFSTESSSSSSTSYGIPNTLSTPILDRFLKQQNAKESYLPTLQALPGKVEFTYLPDNTQEALLLPIQVDSGEKERLFALTLGSDTAKSFTPRDVAWCQVLARRMGTFMVK